MKKLIIGIDPDTNKSGYATFWPDPKTFSLHELTLWEIFIALLDTKGIDVLVRIEAGHKDKSTWHKGGNGMAKRVGANNEIGRQIEKFCIAHNIKLQLVKPHGLSQMSHETFCKITGWDLKVKTNPEKRVAGILAYNGKL